jgi:hypothetical protein
MKKSPDSLSRFNKFPRGVFKVKMGYNPNSSSIGTAVYTFPYAVIVIGLIVSIIGVLLKGRKKNDRSAP